jgi:hypothetical protein
LNQQKDNSCPSEDFHKGANEISAKVPKDREDRLAIIEDQPAIVARDNCFPAGTSTSLDVVIA